MNNNLKNLEVDEVRHLLKYFTNILDNGCAKITYDDGSIFEGVISNWFSDSKELNEDYKFRMIETKNGQLFGKMLGDTGKVGLDHTTIIDIVRMVDLRLVNKGKEIPYPSYTDYLKLLAQG